MSADRPPSWSEVLRRIERQLDAYRACLVGGPLPEPYQLPTGLGPIPVHLASRARDLLEQHRGIEAALEARRARIGAALARQGAGISPSRPPAFLDARI